MGFEDRLHEMHESGGNVGEAEWEDEEFEMAVASSECGFVDVIGMDSDLMISRSQIDFAEPPRSMEPIEELIDPRKRIAIFNRDPVEITIIDTHPHAAILLLHEEDGSPERRFR